VTEIVYTLPWSARLAIGHLLADATVDDLVGSNVFTDIAEGAYPCVQVIQFPGRIIEGRSVHWLQEDLLQVNCFGGSRSFAHDLAAECQRSFKSLSGSVTYTVGPSTISAVVTGVEVGGIADQSDTGFTPAKPFSRFDVVLTSHPSQSGS
jgi:hypothetical protein